MIGNLAMGLLGARNGVDQRKLNSMVNGDNDLYRLRPLNSVIPYVHCGVLPCVGLLYMMMLQGCPYLSLSIV